ncbi:MAG: ABC transporter substrate-binding protein [Thiobacillaceae bacterium]
MQARTPSAWPSILACLLLIALLGPAHAERLIPVVLATAGPGNLSHLPVDLIKKIGADRAEGINLEVRYFPGGPLAFKDMLEKNADFAVAGAPALAALRLKGEPVVSIATVNRVPTFTLMVRRDLEGKVKRVADLRGRVIGVNTSSVASKSTSQQVAEYLLRTAGVDPERVHFVPAGQSLEDQTAALDSGAVDALMGDEPFASQLKQAGKVYILADLHDRQTVRSFYGGLFLNAQLATRSDVLAQRPALAARMVRVLRRTLQWIAAHSPEEIAARLDTRDRALLIDLLRRHKAIYSPDGAFTEEQIRTAERFFQATHANDPEAQRFRFSQMIDPRWAGLASR